MTKDAANNANSRDQVTDLSSLNKYTNAEYARISQLPDSKLKIDGYKALRHYVDKTSIDLADKQFDFKQFMISMDLLTRIQRSIPAYKDFAPETVHVEHESIQHALDTVTNQIQLCAAKSDGNANKAFDESTRTTAKLDAALKKMKGSRFGIKKIVDEINMIWDNFKENRLLDLDPDPANKYVSTIWEIVSNRLEQIKNQMIQLCQTMSDLRQLCLNFSNSQKKMKSNMPKATEDNQVELKDAGDQTHAYK